MTFRFYMMTYNPIRGGVLFDDTYGGDSDF